MVQKKWHTRVVKAIRELVKKEKFEDHIQDEEDKKGFHPPRRQTFFG